MSLLDLEPNIPKVDLTRYTFVIAGTPKIGKTALFGELILKHLKNPRKGLLLACEPGYKALGGIIAKDINEYSDFTTTVDELVRDREKMPFDLIGVDTVDMLVEQCGKQVVREYNRDNPTARVRDVDDIPWGGGSKKIRAKVEEQLIRLIKAGYGLFVITHSQEKKVKQQGGEDYDQLQPSLPGKTGTAIENMADFIVFITNSRGKDGDTKRWMHFRDDGYIKAGGRFTNVPDKVEYGLDNFVQVFTDAIKGSFEGVDMDMDEAAKVQAEEGAQAVKEFVEQEKERAVVAEANPADLIASIEAKVKAMSPDEQKKVAAEFKKIAGTVKYASVTDVEQLDKMLKAC